MLAAVCFLMLMIIVLQPTFRVAGRRYYVSQDGCDSNDGRSPEKAWRTLDRVNGEPLFPGDTILFRRGDSWRGQLRPRSGSTTACIIYSAYGSGEKPLLLGSVKRSAPGDWRSLGDDIWITGGADSSGDSIPLDVGNIILNGGPLCGVKKWSFSELKTEGDYWYDWQRHVLVFRSKNNPALTYTSIECALRKNIIDESGKSYIVFENLCLKYGAAHGIGGDSTHHITVTNCDLSFIGGGDQRGGGRTVRFGNGIEFWGNAHDNLVTRCRLWEIYDAALTNQNGGASVQQFNIYYRCNMIWNCEYSFEYWNRPKSSLTHDIYFENNTCAGAGYGWGHTQRPDPSGRHLCFYESPAPAQRIYIRNNIFCGAKQNGFYAPQWFPDGLSALQLDHNCWYQPAGIMIHLAQRDYTMEQLTQYQSDQHQDEESIAADPIFTDAAHADFSLGTQSPCRNAGSISNNCQ